jgi:hypothetical protein
MGAVATFLLAFQIVNHAILHGMEFCPKRARGVSEERGKIVERSQE